ncbi:MBL fold metallo-hydrolase [Prescottella agglutinans]|uniref:Glyoxylase-like metal-dependent hydrolase (Beta-lactamase superfamily II) n=1 Tax=Prescottella agglutinans TaxID=1644129 RepID=A0ABT6MC20_9NOCA|nr:MBL fold metallo-hydrolase [Prescottella agglutinans]MDH6281420.1 glyoxylase-like metal-dependent hydrolase (beta-lactamase superfamily II) [Prescottella agglutinans]
MTDVSFPTKKIGDYTVTALSDGYLPASLDLLLNVDHHEASELQQRGGLNDQSPMHINSYLVRGAGHTVLVDAGAGGIKHWGGHLTAGLPLAGVQPSDIDTILLTHAHPDHVGGLLDGSGQVVFPNAELLIHQREVAFWQDDGNLARANERARGNFQIARRALDAYGSRLRTFKEGEVLPGISAAPLPGHTDGHTGYLINSEDQSVFFWGDTVHFPAVQVTRPDASVTLDNDPVRAADTRSQVLEMVSTEHLLVAGPHLNDRGFARVERSSTGYSITDEG